MMTITRRRAFAALLFTAAVAAAAIPRAAEKRAITDTDLFRFVWVADPQIAPDGSQVAFVRVTVNEKKDTYESSLWIVPTSAKEAPRRLTGGTRDLSPRWSPDGTQIAFTRSDEKDGRPQPSQVYVLPLAGGEARAITDLPKGAAVAAWSPDGKTIAFTSTANDEDLKRQEAEKDPKFQKPRESDVRVITEAVYRANGAGYTDPTRPSQAWVVAVPAPGAPIPKARRITSDAFGVGNLRWSPDSSALLFTADRRKEEYYYPNDRDLYMVPIQGRTLEPQRLVSIEGTIGDFGYAPDGMRLSFVGTLHGTPERSFSQPDLWVVDAKTGATPKNLTTAYDFDIRGGVGGDQRAPRGGSPSMPTWSKDGRAIYTVVGEQGNANLKRIDATTGQVEPVTSGSQDVMSYTATPDGSTFAMVVSTQTTIGDLYALDASAPGAKPVKLTDFNADLWTEITVSDAEEFWYPSFDGRKIQGWIMKPPGFDPSKKYPLILEIHGGPHSAYGNTFTHEFQWMAAKGYVVLFTNPRGSSNYGQDFGNIIQFRYPGDDYKDLMAGVDAVLKRGYIDEKRMGVTGGSGGGLLTNWVVTQTTRFQAAVAQRDIADWANFWYTADFTLFTPTWFRKAPFEDPQDFAARSPITHVAKVTTPMMFILGEADYRTPPTAGGEDMFRALEYRKIPTVMVRFPDESHELSRSGKPWHRIERLQHIVGWMDHWLMGQKDKRYEKQ